MLKIMVGLLVISSLFTGIFCFNSEYVEASMIVNGDITTNTRWTSSNSPYIIKSDIRVHKGATLTIDPGVVVKFDGEFSIVIEGKLIASGTSNNKIKFTSNKTTPKKGDWYTIRLRTGNNIIKYADFEYAKYGVFITYFGGNNKITNNDFKFCSVDGIYITNSNNNTISNCNITSNNGYGITVYDSDHTIIENLNIENNFYFGIYLNASTNTKIRNCKIFKTSGKGIILYSNSHHTSIINCTVDNNKDKGIDFSGTSNNLIENTNIRSNKAIGVDFGAITTNQTLKNCIITGSGSTGLDLRGSSNIKIFDCNISNNYGYGGIHSEWDVSNIIINNTDIIDNYEGNGIDFYGASSMILNNSRVINNMGHGITLGPSDFFDNEIKNCIILKNSGRGIYSHTIKYKSMEVTNNNFSYNIISLNSLDGIYFEFTTWYQQMVKENIIYKNSIFSNNGQGICFDGNYHNDAFKNYIINNSIYRNTRNGISYQGGNFQSYDNLISNNPIFQNGDNGIYFYGSYYRNKIEKNIIHSNSKNGIYFEARSSGQYNKIYSNHIYSNSMNGVFFNAKYNGFHYNELDNNFISKNQNHGLYFFVGFNENSDIYLNSLTNNTISNNSLSGISFHSLGVSYIVFNTIINCSMSTNNDGIKFENSIMNSIKNCLIAKNQNSGIELKIGSNSNNIKNNNIISNQGSGILITNNSNSNIITNNNISTNFKVGINVSNTEGHKIHHNNFINNTLNAYDSTIALNNWDDGAQGNSWSDYTGTDDNRDGFGEDPYVVLGGGSRDWHPFIEFINFSYPKVISISPLDQSEKVPVNTKVTITFSKKMNTSWVETATSISGGFILTNPIWTSGNTVFTFQAHTNFSFNSTYFVNISTLAQDAFGNPMLKSFSSQFTTGPPRKPTPPTIIDCSPTGTTVMVNSEITVTFSELMDQSSVESAFSISPAVDGKFRWEDTLMIFRPNINLKYKTDYLVKIYTTAKDIEYDFLSSEFNWNFTTRSAPQPKPPTIISYSPKGSNVPVDSRVTVVFSELMDRNTVESAFRIVPTIDGSFEWTWVTLTFIPSQELKYITQYSVSVDTNAEDLENEHLRSKLVWQFTTEPEKVSSPPRIVDNTPEGNAVPIESVIIVEFSEPMDKSTVENAFSTAPDLEGAFKWDKLKIIFSPNSPLQYSTCYTVSVNPEAMDLENEHLTIEFSWSFTTVEYIEPTPPIIKNHSPIGDNIIIKSIITVTFSEPMEHESTQDAFYMYPNVIGNLSWVGNIMVFTPDSALDYGTTYSVKIDIQAMDLDGEHLETDFEWQFKTKDIVIIEPVLDHLIIITESSEFKVGEEHQFNAKGFDTDSKEIENLIFLWELDNVSEIGTIDRRGVFTALNPGKDTLTVLAEGKVAKIDIEVTAADVEPEKALSVQDKGKNTDEGLWSWVLILILVTMVMIAILSLFFFYKRSLRRRNQLKSETKPESSQITRQDDFKPLFQQKPVPSPIQQQIAKRSPTLTPKPIPEHKQAINQPQSTPQLKVQTIQQPKGALKGTVTPKPITQINIKPQVKSEDLQK